MISSLKEIFGNVNYAGFRLAIFIALFKRAYYTVNSSYIVQRKAVKRYAGV